jgi:AraC-like DNA-binding protein
MGAIETSAYIGIPLSATPRVIFAHQSRAKPGVRWQDHVHTHYVLDFISAGQARWYCNGQALPLRPGHVYVYQPGDVINQAQVLPTSPELVACGVTYSLPAGSNTDTPAREFPRVFPLRPVTQREFQRNFDLLLENYRTGQPAWELSSAGYLQIIFSILLRELATGRLNSTAVLDRRLVLATSYMASHLSEPFKIARVAEAAQLSENYFRRIFRRQMRISPIQYLIQIRLQHARHLLIENPGSNVYTVCRQAGFNDPKHFTRLFQNHFGACPREFRSNLWGSAAP